MGMELRQRRWRAMGARAARGDKAGNEVQCGMGSRDGKNNIKDNRRDNIKENRKWNIKEINNIKEDIKENRNGQINLMYYDCLTTTSSITPTLA